jgi:GMP synthase (glutamine-hydrolysing)
LKRELRLIERTLHAGLPVLGVCLGSQLLATSLGASVRPAKETEIGWFAVDVHARAEDDALFAGVRAIMPLHWHSDVFTLPRGAVPLAKSAKTAVQAYRHDARTYGILFHMEVTVPMVRRATKAFRQELEKEGIAPAKLVAGAERHFGRTSKIARTVFGRWAALCQP